MVHPPHCEHQREATHFPITDAFASARPRSAHFAIVKIEVCRRRPWAMTTSLRRRGQRFSNLDRPCSLLAWRLGLVALRWADPDHRHLIVVAILTRGNAEAQEWLWSVLSREEVRELVREYRGACCAEPERAQLRKENRPESEMEALFREDRRMVDAMMAKEKYKDRVGAFEGCIYEAKGYYRPQVD